MKLSCIIVDDEPIARQILEQFCKEDGRLEILTMCKNALEAMAFLNQNRVDLVFLDINMPKLTGLEMLSTLKEKPMVIFTTAYREYAVEGFEQNALDYLVKPIAFQRFLQAVNRAFERKGQKIAAIEFPDFFFVKSDGKNIKVYFKDILYIEAMSEYIKIVAQEKSHLVLQSLTNMEQKLPSNDFLRVHRSYLIALDKMEALEGNQIIIKESKIPVSKSYRPALNDLIAKYNL